MRHNRNVFAVMGILCCAFILLYIFLGLTPETWSFYFPRRVKIVMAIFVVGTAIGLSSVTFQTITANHILTPNIMGMDNLYLFLQTVVVYVLGSGRLSMLTDMPGFLATLLLMVGSSTLLFALMFRGEGRNVYFLVLVGLIFGTVFSGLASFMQVIIDPSEYSVLEGRMYASFNRVNVNLLGITIALVVGVCAAQVADFRSLDVITLGRDHAVNLGVRYRSVVLRSLVATAVLTSSATVLVGPITFLGILAVSLARALLRSWRHSVLVSGCALTAVTVLMLGLLLTERFLLFRTPLSVIINFAGGLYFLSLLLRRKAV